MKRNDQQAYDRGTSLFSPDGRIYQVEYAREAVKRGAPAVGVRASDGVVLAAQTRTSSSLMETESVEKLHKLDDHIGAASAGHVADARQLVDDARQECQVNRLRYGEPIGLETLTKALTDDIQESTQFGGTRPYGASLLIGGMDGGEPGLFATDPSGTPQEWKAVAIGGSRGEIQEFLEENWSADLSTDDAVTLALEALLSGVDSLTGEEASVAVVTADGYRHLSVDEVDEVLEDVLPEDAAADEDEDE
ncbi:archaeal proteasome endopeptidase complex subunit alpha [Salinigranum halophilum]|jgi:proteasome alpha subunit|uniref:archaeal proteasome endopeptidase complex subunit alpha n=1 Tax=Salinigranum halophilum TaxID=2565931 RepID=UPI0010A8F0A1|nr:archaeal proteasome endopeptidase complex subunit alpha [Salinigranum halophilum]